MAYKLRKKKKKKEFARISQIIYVFIISFIFIIV